MARVEMVAGSEAPRYEDTNEVYCEKVVITEEATKQRLPIVDFVMTDADGRKYLMVLTGRIVNAISAAIRGANMRNHGVEEP